MPEISMEQMNIVIVGHVDHGKSTVIGRLLVDTDSLPSGKLEQVKSLCEKNSKPFEYAFLLDALKDEQAQGITIDSARIFFKTKQRYYIIIDAPGHIEFLKNMISGASRAEAALLVIDAHEGIQENTKRHGYMLSMLGISQVVVIVNKMDLVDYRQDIYEQITVEYREFLGQFGLQVDLFIPASGREGDNVASLSLSMPWYHEDTILQTLDKFKKKSLPIKAPLRMMVQDVYKFTEHGDKRRIIAGTIDSGTLKVNDEIVFYPQGKKGQIKTIEAFHSPKINEREAGYAIGFTLQQEIYVKRGMLLTKVNDLQPKCTSRLIVSIFWLGQKHLLKGKKYILKYGSARVSFFLEEIKKVINASNLQSMENTSVVEYHSVAECILQLEETLAFDEAKDECGNSRFVIVDNYEIVGGGIIRKALEDRYSEMRDKVILRNQKWEKSIISPQERAEKYNQKSTLIIITGNKDVGKKELAKKLELKLFADGKFVYFLGIANVLYGVDADIKNNNNQDEEHFRRLAEVANIVIDMGAILIVTAVNVKQSDIEIIKLSVNPGKIISVWVGEEKSTDITCDLFVSGLDFIEESLYQIRELLRKKGIIFSA